jgi:hypothetical protein
MKKTVSAVICLFLLLACSVTPTFVPTATETPAALLATIPPAPAVATSTAAMGLGVTRLAVQAVFESRGITFDPPVVENGETIVQGMYANNERGQEIMVFVILAGPEENLTSTYINVLIPISPPANAFPIVSENPNTMLSLVAPEWETGRSWVDASISTVVEPSIVYNRWNDLAAEFEFRVFNTEEVLGLDYGLYLVMDSETNHPVSAVTPMPTPTAMTGWKLYYDPFISFQYPDTWLEQDMLHDDTCQDLRAGCLISLEIPDKGWVSIIRPVLNEPLDVETLDEFLWTTRVEMLAEQGMADSLVLESRQVFTIDGRAVIKRVFSEPNLQAPGQNAYVIEVLFVQDWYTYTILLTAPERNLRDEVAPDFERMLESIDLYP